VILPPGALNIQTNKTLVNDSDGLIGVSDALAPGATTQFALGIKVIRVSEVGSSKFKLTGV
jgi:hypothetical protein